MGVNGSAGVALLRVSMRLWRTARGLERVSLTDRYGLEPSFSGVEVMKNSIHRRIAEGPAHVSTELRQLANAARQALGIAPIPEYQSASAEQALQSMLGRQEEGWNALTGQSVSAALSVATAKGSLSSSNVRLLTSALQERKRSTH